MINLKEPEFRNPIKPEELNDYNRSNTYRKMRTELVVMGLVHMNPDKFYDLTVKLITEKLMRGENIF